LADSNNSHHLYIVVPFRTALYAFPAFTTSNTTFHLKVLKIVLFEIFVASETREAVISRSGHFLAFRCAILETSIKLL